MSETINIPFYGHKELDGMYAQSSGNHLKINTGKKYRRYDRIEQFMPVKGKLNECTFDVALVQCSFACCVVQKEKGSKSNGDDGSKNKNVHIFFFFIVPISCERAERFEIVKKKKKNYYTKNHVRLSEMNAC